MSRMEESVADLEFKYRGVVRENERLRKTLKAFVTGTHHEICVGRVAHECEECSMRKSKKECVMTDAMDFFSDDEVIDLLMSANQ